MAIDIKGYNDIVSDILDRLRSAGVGFSDAGGRTIIQTVIECIAVELDINYEKLQYLYDSLLIDNASDIELDRLVAIFNVTRKPSTQATGLVRFSRTSPATTDITIPIGTIVSTPTDINGLSYEFVVDEETKILTGDTTAECTVIATSGGHIVLVPGSISVIDSSIIGVETVSNYTIDGGTDTEDDVSLRERAKEAISGLGKGTESALMSAVKSIPDIVDVTVYDMARGVGTVDLVVVGSSIPMDSDLMAIVVKVMNETKAAGIDAQVVEPTVITTDITVTVTLAPGIIIDDVMDGVGNAITKYFSTLKAGSSLIMHQLNRFILTANTDVIDIVNVTPDSNVAVSALEILRVGTVTINGDVW